MVGVLGWARDKVVKPALHYFGLGNGQYQNQEALPEFADPHHALNTRIPALEYAAVATSAGATAAAAAPAPAFASNIHSDRRKRHSHAHTHMHADADVDEDESDNMVATVPDAPDYQGQNDVGHGPTPAHIFFEEGDAHALIQNKRRRTNSGFVPSFAHHLRSIPVLPRATSREAGEIRIDQTVPWDTNHIAGSCSGFALQPLPQKRGGQKSPSISGPPLSRLDQYARQYSIGQFKKRHETYQRIKHNSSTANQNLDARADQPATPNLLKTPAFPPRESLMSMQPKVLFNGQADEDVVVLAENRVPILFKEANNLFQALAPSPSFHRDASSTGNIYLAAMLSHPLFQEKQARSRRFENYQEDLNMLVEEQKTKLEQVRKAEQCLVEIRARGLIYRSRVYASELEKEDDYSFDLVTINIRELDTNEAADEEFGLDTTISMEKLSALGRVLTVEDETRPLSRMTDKAQRRVLRRWVKFSKKDHVLVTYRGMSIQGTDFARIMPGNWLNDEIINLYMELLKDRQERRKVENPATVKCHFVNTFFYAKLAGETDRYEYGNVRRWTKKVDVFSMGRIMIPINIKNTHWALCMVDVKKKRVEYFDSLGFENRHIPEAIRKWLVDEAKDKKQMVLDPDEYSIICHGATVPQQKNSDDCGMFTCKFMDYLTGSRPLFFTADCMKYFRRRLAHELLSLRV